MSVLLCRPTLYPRALRSCTTHRIHEINKGFENAIEKETVGRKQAVSVLYKEKLESGDTIEHGPLPRI